MKIFPYFFASVAWLALSCATPALAADSCASTCHSAIRSPKRPHAPVKEGDCTSCHTQRVKEHPLKGEKSFEPAAKGGALCEGCHEGMGKKKFQHAPVKEDCTSCHKPHGTDEPFLLEVGEDRTTLCLNCHDPAPFKAKYMHGPAAVGSCNDCHAPHESSEKALLDDTVQGVCLKCHADFAATMKGATFVHPPVRDSACTACHKAHGSDVMMFLNDKMPDLCVGCHKNIGKVLASAKVAHKPVVQDGGCANCHSAHFSSAKGLLASDQMGVCLGCHGKDDVGKLKNIKKQLDGAKMLHGPIQKGDCKACHDPHGSANFRLLRGAYPAELYVPYKDGVYEACLKCHEKNLLRFPETTLYTNFRNGKRNLHYVHVSMRKGRTCRICHEPHASTGEKLISKEGARFGDWKIPLNFSTTSTGGSCAPGCHRKFKYDRTKAEVYN